MEVKQHLVSSYIVDPDVAKHQDLMFAVAPQQVKTLMRSSHFNFQHAYQVRFRGRVATNNLYVQVAKIAMHNIAHTGTFEVAYGADSTAGSNTDADDDADANAGEGTDDFQNKAGIWSNIIKTQSSGEQDLNKGTYVLPLSVKDAFGGEAQEIVFLAGVNSTKNKENSPDSAIILLPQNIRPWDTTESIWRNNGFIDGAGEPKYGSFLAIDCVMYYKDPADVTGNVKEYLIGGVDKDDKRNLFIKQFLYLYTMVLTEKQVVMLHLRKTLTGYQTTV